MKKFIAGAVAFVVLFACVITTAVTGGFSKKLTVISIDVNPSIQLVVDADGTIDEAIGVNADAKAIIDALDLEGLELDAALDLIIGSLVEENYISEIANSILISVNNEDLEIAEKYEKLAVDTVNKILKPLGTDINIISQIVDSAAGDVAKLAKELGISEGKAQFITNIIAENDHLSADMLAKMSINDISLLISSNAVVSPNGLEITGHANAQAYISKCEALAAVLKNLGIPVEDVAAADVSFNYKEGVMVFDVTFIYDENEFSVSVNASTADILKVLKQEIDLEQLIKDGVDITASEGIDESVKEIFGVTEDELIKEAVDSMINEDGTINENGVNDFVNKKLGEVIDKNIPSTGNEELDSAIKDVANEVIDDTIDNAVDKGVDNYLKENGITTGNPETDEELKNAAAGTIKEAIENGTLDELLGMLGK